MKFEEIKDLIIEEQKKSDEMFIRGADIEEYIYKISSKAEFIAHYVEGRCAGFVAFYCNDFVNKNAFITLVLIAPSFRGQGLSNILIKCVLGICKKRKFKACFLEVYKDNYPAIKLYRSLGFFELEEKEEKIIMKLEFD